jgi:diguanylate cyclase (GGDEF)-like protein
MPNPAVPTQTTPFGGAETQLNFVRRGMRAASAVGSLQMTGFMLVSGSHSFHGSFLPREWLWGLLALSVMTYCWVALRPEAAVRSMRQAVVEITLVLTVTMALCSATGPIHAPGQAFVHTSTIGILFGCAVLVLLPVRAGAVSMCAIASAYPLVQWLYPSSDASTLQLAMATVNITLGLGAALFMLAWHDRMLTSARQAADALADIVERDSLTGVLGRASIESYGRRALYDVHSGRDAVVCVVDIDQFKRFNTEFGYTTGDAVLKEVTRRLMRTLGSRFQSRVGRTGGEEFVAVCPTTRKQDILQQVEAFLTIMREERFAVGDKRLQLSASVGVASTRELALNDWESVLHAADQAMYRAKYRGGQQFSEALREDLEPVSPGPAVRNRSDDQVMGLQSATSWIQRERERVHTALLCIALCLCALWQPFLLVLDLVRVREGLTETSITAWVFYRSAGCVLSAGAAWYVSNSGQNPARTGWLHAVFSLIIVLSAVFGTGADDAAMGPFGLCMASVGLILWNLALGLPTRLVRWSSFGLAALYLLLPLVLVPSAFWLAMPAPDHVYRFMTIGSALALAFTGRQHFMELRDNESLMRHELGVQSRIDALTGLPNRRALHQRMQRAAEMACGERRVSLMLVDIDHFKRINDDHGHAVGDQVIVAIGKFLKSLAPADALVARQGGEEFAVVFVHTSDHADAELAHRMVAGARTLQNDRIRRPMTLSVGVAMWREGDDEGSWMHRADSALRRAKREGRDRVVVAEHPDATPVPLFVPSVRGAADEL